MSIVISRTGERKLLRRGGFFARYIAGTVGSNGAGHLVYLRQSTAFAAPFHAGRLALSGAPVPILENVSSTTTGGGDFAFAQNGTFVYLAGKAQAAGGGDFVGRW